MIVRNLFRTSNSINLGGAKMSLSIAECIRAGYSSVIIQTAEENRAICKCFDAAKHFNFKLYGWSCTKGIFEVKEPSSQDDGIFREISINQDAVDPVDAMKLGTEQNENQGNYIIFFLDFHHYLKRPDVLRAARDAFSKCEEMGINYFFISNRFDIPDDWKEKTISISFDLPKKKEIELLYYSLLEQYRPDIKGKPKEIKNLLAKAVRISLGLTLSQAEGAFAMSISQTKSIDLQVFESVKAQIICNDGLLEYWNNSKDIEIGGMQNFKSYTRKRLLAFSDEAQAYGLPYPKGVLLVGIPGCGKSLAAKSLAKQWCVPLLKCDLGKLFGGYVGDTENNTRKALKTAEAMAPCVLWIDEIEKGLAGVNSGGRNDSGVTSRMFATILTWMQEKSVPVYVVATANSIEAIPKELLRKGRFDEIFFVDLPTEVERNEIVNIQLKKIGRTFNPSDVQAISAVCDGFTGAEIEEAIISALFNSYDDGGREITASDIISVMENSPPSSKGLMHNTVEALRTWAKENAVKNASASPKSQASESTANIVRRTGRKIIMDGGNSV